MKKIWTILIVSFFVLITAMGNLVIASNNIKKIGLMSSQGTEQFIPLIGNFTIRSKYVGGFDFEPHNQFNENITNWTTPNQQVKIVWHIINEYNSSEKITLLIRIREWSFTHPLPLIWWILKGGIVSTPDFPLIDNTDFPKFYRFKINMLPHSESYGSKIVNISFDPNFWTSGSQIQVYSLILCQGKSPFLNAKGGLIIHVP